MKLNPQLSHLNPLLGRRGANLLALLALALFSAPLFAAIFTVNDLGDAPDAIPSDGICATASNVCTLRAAIQTANVLGGSNVINVPAGTIVLGSALSLASDTTVNGASTSSTVISGNGVTQVFLVSAINGVVTAMNDLTIADGNSTIGAGIFVGNVTLSLTRVLVTNNAATVGSIKQGGGISVGGTGTLNLTDSTISNNSAGFVGGGIVTRPGTTVNISGSTIVGNSVTLANGAGGGIANNGGTLNVINSTVSGNTAPLGDGGGITTIAQVGSSTNIRFSTLTANSALFGGAQLDQIPQGALAPVVNVSASIVANPASGPNCGGNVLPISGGNNLDSGNTCGFSAAGDLTNSNPQLAALANNGGPTQTHALLAASPAINAGPTTGSIPATDQRGVAFARVQSGRADIGAYESAFSPPVLIAPVIINAAFPPGGTLGIAYSYFVIATGSVPITFSLGTGALPPGVSIDPTTGLISGTPTGVGTFTGTIVASNGTLPNGSLPFSIVIAPAAVALPTANVGDASIVEGNAGTSVLNFPVTLSAAAPAGGVTITYSTADGSATAGSDYVAVVAGMVTIAQGATTGNLPVTINGDTTVEPDETFTVTISNVTNATLGTASALGTILNDDAVALPVLTLSDAIIVEGNAGSSVLNFPITLSSAAPVGGVTITYSTANGTATAGSDYVAVVAGMVTIAAGATTGSLPVTINGDMTVEADETFTVTMTNVTNATISGSLAPKTTATGTIINDDVAAVMPVVSVGNASVLEGNVGNTLLNFPITLSTPAPAGGVTITYTTANGSATAGSDYVAIVNGTVTIAQGATAGSLPVTIIGDSTVEPDETVIVTISSVTNATLGTATATGTIVNDDVFVPPVVSIGVTPVPVDNPWALFMAMLGVIGFALRDRSAVKGHATT